MDQARLANLLYRIKNCTDYDSLYALSTSLNEVGLAVLPTTRDRMVLCRIVEGKPVASKIIDDYLFVGSITGRSSEISDRQMTIITDFVSTNAGEESIIEDVPRKWQQGVFTYGMTLPISNDAIASPAMPIGEGEEPENDEVISEDVISETQPKGATERVARTTRAKRADPPIKNDDKTPKKPANNDPIKTARGKASVRRQGERNKRHADKFKEDIDPSIKAMLQAEGAALAEMVEKLDDPIRESIKVKKFFGEDNSDQLRRIDEAIRNIWSNRLIERYAGVCKPGLRDELALFDKAAKLFEELRDWGAKFCWIERVHKPSMVIYKACTDSTPSDTYMERRSMEDRNLILSSDRANIIQIATESDNA